MDDIKFFSVKEMNTQFYGVAVENFENTFTFNGRLLMYI